MSRQPQPQASHTRRGLAVAPFAVVTILGDAGAVTTALLKKRRALTDSPSGAGNEEKQERGRVISSNY